MENLIYYARYAEKRSLTRHVAQFHTESYICGICNIDFVSKSNLNTHNALVHENKELYECNHCDALLNGKGSLKRHIEGKKFTMIFSKKSFEDTYWDVKLNWISSAPKGNSKTVTTTTRHCPFDQEVC